MGTLIIGLGDKHEVIVVGLMSGDFWMVLMPQLSKLKAADLMLRRSYCNYYSEAYDDALRERLKQLCTVEHSNVSLVCGMNALLAERFAEVVNKAVNSSGLSIDEIDFISSHGQTIWHMIQSRVRMISR